MIHVVEKMDAGNVITASTLHIDQGWTTSELHDELARQGPACVRKVLDAIGAQLSIAGHVQNDAHVFYARKIHREDAWIDFGRSSDECRRRINGLSPSPGVAVRCGRIEFKVVRSVTADADIMPQAASGQLVDVVRGRVRCGDFRDLVMLQVQPTGKHVMNWEDFARGYPLSACETLVSVQPIKS